MSLSRCPDCNRQVSDRAGACPHCGCPLRDPDFPARVRTAEDSFLTRSRGCGDLVLYGTLGLLILLMLAFSSC